MKHTFNAVKQEATAHFAFSAPDVIYAVYILVVCVTVCVVYVCVFCVCDVGVVWMMVGVLCVRARARVLHESQQTEP